MSTIIALAFCLLLGVMVGFQGITALLWFPVGLVFGLFVTAQMVLPIIMGLPRAISLVHKRKMRPAVFGRIILTPAVWFVQLPVLGFITEFFWPAAIEYLYNNISLNLGAWLGTVAIILTPLSKKGRSDFREDFDRVYQRFYTEEVPTVAVAVRDAFSAASDAYDAAFRTIESYTTRANHCYAILNAKLALYKASLGDTVAADTYDEAVAPYTDPADFDPYTEAYLDAHTAAIDTLTAAFDNLTVAFDALNPTDNLYASAAALYKSYCDIYEFAANAYDNAAYCAKINALEGQLQVAKDDFEVGLLEDRAANADTANAVTANTKATVFKAKAAEDANKAKALEQKARTAETKAEIFLAKAESAEVKAEEVSETNQ